MKNQPCRAGRSEIRIMCEICRQTPCHSRCPQTDVRAACFCRNCYAGIWPGQEFYQSAQGPVCMECISEMTVRDVIRMVGEKLDIA